MNDIIERIQQDILNPEVSLSTILFKAKVLAYKLKNEKFKQWVKCELDGYPDAIDLPDYRRIEAPLVAFIFNGFNGQRNVPISLSSCPDWFQEVAGVIRFTSGIRTAEALSRREDMVSSPWQAEWIAVWNQHNPLGAGGHRAVEVNRPVTPASFTQMVETVRSRLQDFILELSDISWDMSDRPLPSEQIENLVAITIYNSNESKTTSTFDQRDQQVQNQSNVARDINTSSGPTGSD